MKIIFVFVSCFLIICFSRQEEINKQSNICEKKCKCDERSNIYQLPLFIIDCTRLDLNQGISQNYLPNITGSLDVSHNFIKNLNDSSKLNSKALFVLNYSYNKIENISEKHFENLPQLLELHLNHNKLTYLNKNHFIGLQRLELLNLESNLIQQLPSQTFTTLSSLLTLNLNFNKLGRFLMDQILSDYIPNQIENLFLNGNNLEKISNTLFNNLSMLKKLTLAYNGFNSLPHLDINSLEFLDISETNLSNVFTNNLSFSNLKTLKMNRLINLRNIDSYAFYNLPNLEKLYLEHCIHLENIHPIVFGRIDNKNSTKRFKLKIFSIAYSGLKTLSKDFQLAFETLEEIYLNGNAWDCDCQILWFTKFNDTIKNIDDVRCNSPEDQINKTIRNLKNEEFNCASTDRKQRLSSSSYDEDLRSWLFHIIGFLTVLVLILLALLIYMGPYGQNIYKIKGKYFGPNSPYNYQMTSVDPNHIHNL